MSRRPKGPAALLGALMSALACAGAAGPAEVRDGLEGFSARGAADQDQLERRFDSLISPADLRAWMQEMSSAPNHVGSAHDRANAEFILKNFRDWGWDASIEEFSVLYPTPREESVELLAPSRFVAALREPPVAGDSVADQMGGALPAYNVYGGDGDVKAELVYVNQGMPDDYAELERRHISVQGRIVIARYGGGWRGLKPKLAQEHGAAGCLIYSDPREDGYGAGDVYPRGGYRPADGVQRGSVEDMTLYAGDPLTPGVGATPGAKRLDLKNARNVLKIPVLPLSYADAQPLLSALGGEVAPAAWRGALPITYHLGPGPALVHLKVLSDWGRKSLYDVIAKIPGAEQPDRWIIRGNHHDAWVFGASDPLSGQVALMAEAKAIGALVKAGWRPRRTLVYASWDGEEAGLLGSTEWAETHADELHSRAVLYVNSDMNSRGSLDVQGSHALQHFVSQVARDVQDPEVGGSVQARALALRRVAAFEAGRAPESGKDLVLGALGSGSDYTPFLQHLGVDSLNLEFHGEGDYGVYHSAYDTFDHFRRFVDPDFRYGVALAQVAGRIVLRAAQADLLPAREGDFAEEIGAYADELHKLVEGMRSRSRALAPLLDDGAFELAADPQRPRAPPPRLGPVPYLSFAELDNAVERLRTSAKAFDAEYRRVLANGGGSPARLDDALSGLESSLTDSRGLPGRPWYQHMIYAPGAKTGYGVKTLPGIREAIEERRWEEADLYMGVVAHALNAYSGRLEAAVAGP